jgi:putative hemolysin
MLLRDKAKAHNIPLYMEMEFDISKMKATSKNIMEISRSCIHPDYRSKLAINLLWKGIAANVFKNDIGYLIGTPSFHGVNPDMYREELSYLEHFHKADEAICPSVLPQCKRDFSFLPKEDIDPRRVFAKLPPLLKGYLRIGTMIGDGICIDEQFNMIDVSIVLDISKVTDRYFNHYKRYDQ